MGFNVGRSHWGESIMELVVMQYKSGKGLQVVHRCTAYGVMCANKIAGDTVQPDDWEALLRLPAV